MKAPIIAVIAWGLGCALGFFIAYLGSRALRRKNQKLRREIKELKLHPPKKMGTMDKILILEAVAIVLYTIADFAVFWHTGAEPATLTACFFGVLGVENGVMGWIKTNKDRELGPQKSGSEPPDRPAG